MILAPQGELDLASAPELEAMIESTWRTAIELVIIDLRGVAFMDSTGLRVLIGAHQHAQQANRRLGIVDGGDQVHKLLSLTRTLDALEVRAAPAGFLSQIGGGRASPLARDPR